MERFEFQFAIEQTEPPTGSQLRLDADPSAATLMWVRDVAVPGEDVGWLMAKLPEGTRIYVQDYDDPLRWAEFLTSGPAVAKGGYTELPVQPSGVGQPLTAQRVTLMAFAPADALPPEPEPPTPSLGEPGTEFLPDDMDPAEQAEYVAQARLILNAALYPNELPADPLPAPLEVALASVAYAVWQLDAAAEAGDGRPVESESLGSYSYKLRTPSGDTTFFLTERVLELIEPWMPTGAGSAYELHVGKRPMAWPADWFQRNLEEPCL